MRIIFYRISLAVVVLAVLSSCGGDPSQPKKPTQFRVELIRVQLSPLDLNNSTFGNPLEIQIDILQDSEVIPPNVQGKTPPSQVNVIKGTRGERVLSQPIKWDVNFSPNKNYQIRATEQSIIAKAVGWSMPATPRIGYWPFGEARGRASFGRESYLQFSVREIK